ncbi:MAG: NBR1-Ig-like domain-containing protein [Anaerolineales bacterium]
MTKQRLFLNLNLTLLTSIFSLWACAPLPTPTPFRPPTAAPPVQPLPTTTPIPSLFTPIPTPTVTVTPTVGPCSDNLSFLDDVTVDDGTSFLPNASIDKKWLVQNSGTCNWDDAYRLKWVGGDPMGAVQEQSLYPARAGTQATLRVTFTAPAESGSYESAWQAVDPNGNFFGDLIFIKIVVAP